MSTTDDPIESPDPTPPGADPDTPITPAEVQAEPPPAAAAASSASASRGSGRPILGAIAGFLLGIFLWVDLVLFGVIAFESVTFWIFPILGLIAGIVLARWTPFGRSAAS